MTTPAVYGGLNISGHGLGRLGLGGPQPSQSYALPAMSKTALSYIAHLYGQTLNFKKTLGGTTLINKPGLKLTQNAGYQPITLEVSSFSSLPVSVGDVVRLTEQGDPTGSILYSGNVESTPEETGIAGTHHQITVIPWVSELADADFNKTYAVATDVAQFVRDAVVQTAHCSVSPISCPDSGIKAIYDFQSTTGLDAIHVAKQIAGANFWWFCDAQGVVWFQPVNTSNPATITLKRSADFNRKRQYKTIIGQKNRIRVYGGSNPGDPSRMTALYNGVSNQGLYGLRSMNPTPVYPSVSDQTTLNAIAASLGVQFDRVLTIAEADCPALGVRLTPARPGGLTVRFWEPDREVMANPIPLSAGYSSTFVLQDVECLGAAQKIFVGDIPFADTDTAYEATRIAQRISTLAATAVPIPALTPQPPPTSTLVVADFKVTTTGILAMGGGIVTVGSATFTTLKAGTCQVLGQIDARMEAWDNYIATPRRAVWMDLPGIVTGAKQELPFNITRATYDGSSATGIAIPAGTYTVSWNVQTVEFNQIHLYSGWGQVVWTG